MRLATSDLLVVVSFLFDFARFCLSEKLECISTETSDGTFYSVPPYEHLEDCITSWSNLSNHVLAIDDKKADEQVIASNGTSLHTHNCYETIKYYRFCNFEGEKTVNCETKCSQSAGIHNPHHRGPGNGTGTSRCHVPVLLIVLCVLLLVIL